MASVRAVENAVLLEFDRLTARHLRIALEAHKTTGYCHVNVCQLPDALRELLEIARDRAKPELERTRANSANNLLDTAASLLHDPVDEHEAMVTVAEAARQLHVCEVTVRRYIKRRELGAIKLGRSWRIPPGELEAYLVAHGLRAGTHDGRSAAT